MFFGPLPPRAAGGGVLAHRVHAGDRVFGKGHLLSEADCAALDAAGIASVTVARLESGDVGEDDAARQLGDVLARGCIRAAEAFTGRVNLFARDAGILRIDRASLDAFNAIDEGMTLATLPPFRQVVADEMIGTVKIIPFALPGKILAAGLAALSASPVLDLKPFRPKRVALLLLAVPETKPGVLTKTERVTRDRVVALGGSLVQVMQLAHSTEALCAGMAQLDPANFDILIIFGAAAITDRRDVIPHAITVAGGEVIHLGMPVDPGNLLLLAEWRGKPVIGAPGCARSPAENGFDWVLERLCADIPVCAQDIRAMGAGGLLMEIISRPQPRSGGVHSVNTQDDG